MKQQSAVLIANGWNLRQIRQGRPLVDVLKVEVEVGGKGVPLSCGTRSFEQLPGCLNVAISQLLISSASRPGNCSIFQSLGLSSFDRAALETRLFIVTPLGLLSAYRDTSILNGPPDDRSGLFANDYMQMEIDFLRNLPHAWLSIDNFAHQN